MGSLIKVKMIERAMSFEITVATIAPEAPGRRALHWPGDPHPSNMALSTTAGGEKAETAITHPQPTRQ